MITTLSDEPLLFADDPPPAENKAPPQKAPWKIMVVDDEPEVHRVTRFVLSDFRFEGRALQFLSAYSGEEAQEMIAKHMDTALVLLDVVMESDDAGLKVARHIREELKNRFVRIILRTGQPGTAPETRVILEYDINDYKEKSDLTQAKLVTALTTSLRSYRDLMLLEQSREGLATIVQATRGLFETRSLQRFASGVLKQLISIIRLDQNSMFLRADGFAACGDAHSFAIYAATGEYEKWIDQPVEKVVDDKCLKRLRHATEQGQHLFCDGAFIGYFRTQNGSENLLYLAGDRPLEEGDQELIKVFCANVAVAFDNLYLYQELRETRSDVALTLAEVVEKRSHAMGNHIRRVSEMARILGELYGLGLYHVETLGFASALHDLGKLLIPDTILQKPAKLDPMEWDVVKSHAELGEELLSLSKSRFMQSGRVIARQHHERWDWRGYPDGLAGEEIHIFARITALVDVFDALSHSRCDRSRWEHQEILDHLRKQSGQQFDPRLVELFLANVAAFVEVQERYRGEDAAPSE